MRADITILIVPNGRDQPAHKHYCYYCDNQTKCTRQHYKRVAVFRLDDRFILRTQIEYHGQQPIARDKGHSCLIYKKFTILRILAHSEYIYITEFRMHSYVRTNMNRGQPLVFKRNTTTPNPKVRMNNRLSRKNNGRRISLYFIQYDEETPKGNSVNLSEAVLRAERHVSRLEFRQISGRPC